MSQASALELVPLQDVEASAGVVGGWTPHGVRPQLKAVPGIPRLAGGWYSLRVRHASVGAEDGLAAAPVYADFHGMGEPVYIRGGGADRLAIIRLAHDAVALRIEVASAGLFELSGVEITPISRVKAFARMAFEGPDAHGVPTPWRSLLKTLRRKGARGVGEALYAHYGSKSWRRSDDAYAHWLALRAHYAGLMPPLPSRGPLVSILMPVFNTGEPWLRRSISSVIEQTYQDWELCIADDASTLPHVESVLREFAARDARIKVHRRTENGHISAASNTALEHASGVYVALLDHDDELSPDALASMVEAFQRNPAWRFAYSDEDKVDERGRRYDPYFKPDWNPELLLAQNYVCHFSVFEAALLREVGGFRQGFEGSQDHDLVLRASEQLGPGQIGHVPEVLYHWRAIPESTAGGLEAKRYALDAGIRAVAEHLLRTGQDGTVEATAGGYYRVRRGLPAPVPRVSLIIPTRDRVELLKMAVESILAMTDYPDYEIIVVNNQSVQPETLAYFAELGSRGNVRVIDYDAPFNYSQMNNVAASHATGSILGLVNNDIEAIAGEWLGEMASQACRPEVGVVGAMLYYPDDTIQHAGVVAGIGGVAGHLYHKQPRGHHGCMGRARMAQNLSVVTAACLLVRKDVFEEVGGLDPSLKVAFNDVDFCLRVREAGYRNVWTPYAELYHHESASRGYEDTPEKVARFNSEIDYMQARWGAALDNDPAYNPNFSLDAPFELATPSRHLAAALAQRRSQEAGAFCEVDAMKPRNDDGEKQSFEQIPGR